MNIKASIIEKERKLYTDGDVAMAAFLDLLLGHIIELEEQINKRDAEIEKLKKGKK